METVKLSTKGQLVIPKEIRDAHHLAAGTEFAVSFVGNEIRLTPLPAERRPRPVQPKFSSRTHFCLMKFTQHTA